MYTCYVATVTIYGMKKDKLKKIREVNQKEGKGEQFVLLVTDCLNLIHIAIKSQQDIPYGSLVMACI